MNASCAINNKSEKKVFLEEKISRDNISKKKYYLCIIYNLILYYLNIVNIIDNISKRNITYYIYNRGIIFLKEILSITFIIERIIFL